MTVSDYSNVFDGNADLDRRNDGRDESNWGCVSELWR